MLPTEVLTWPVFFSLVLFRYLFFAGVAYLVFYNVLTWLWIPRKIQMRFPKLKDYQREIVYSIITAAIFACSIWALVAGPLNSYTKIYSEISLYGIPYYLLSIVMMVFLHDAYFYWMHRLMHHRKLFRIMHLVHHQSHNPSPWAAYSFHPLEAVLEVGIIWLIVFLFPVHPSALSIFAAFSMAFNVLGHLGFEVFPKNFHKHWLGQWINTSTYHNLHHKYGRENYGLYFTFWDKGMQTLHKKSYSTYEKLTENDLLSKSITKSRPT